MNQEDLDPSKLYVRACILTVEKDAHNFRFSAESILSSIKSWIGLPVVKFLDPSGDPIGYVVDAGMNLESGLQVLVALDKDQGIRIDPKSDFIGYDLTITGISCKDCSKKMSAESEMCACKDSEKLVESFAPQAAVLNVHEEPVDSRMRILDVFDGGESEDSDVPVCPRCQNRFDSIPLWTEGVRFLRCECGCDFRCGAYHVVHYVNEEIDS